jgi:acyl-CoA thioesterase-1
LGFKASILQFVVMTALAFVAAPAYSQDRPLQIVGFGDSLMAGYQLAPTESYTAQLEAALKKKGENIVVTNAGVSGDTTSGGLSRIDWSVPDSTDGVILELGANDALRGISPEQTQKNLDEMISRLKSRNIPVFLIGILAPPNMGQNYADKFNPIYKTLADKYSLPLYPFFLDGVATVPGTQLGDGMHPNPKGVGIMVEKTIGPFESFLGAVKDKKK